MVYIKCMDDFLWGEIERLVLTMSYLLNQIGALIWKTFTYITVKCIRYIVYDSFDITVNTGRDRNQFTAPKTRNLIQPYFCNLNNLLILARKRI